MLLPPDLSAPDRSGFTMMLDCEELRRDAPDEPVRRRTIHLVSMALLVLTGVLSGLVCWERQRRESIWVMKPPTAVGDAASPRRMVAHDGDDHEPEEIGRPSREQESSRIGKSGARSTAKREEGGRALTLDDDHSSSVKQRRLRQQGRQPQNINLKSNRPKLGVSGNRKRDEGNAGAPSVEESQAFQANDIPFLQDGDAFRMPGNGISLEALGEPKSGTTWLGRLVHQLALDLCGSYNNAWCQMGGIHIIPNRPAPWYEFEMLNNTVTEESKTSDPTLFLHYRGHEKHTIPGMDVLHMEEHSECLNGGRMHNNGFDEDPPCYSGEPPTRERLSECLWDASPRCLPFLSNIDPAVSRSIVIFRDPRDVMISEYRMRTTVLINPQVVELTLEEYTRQRFEVLVSWIHQRYIWHTSDAVAPASHLVYYEKSQENPDDLVAMAAFMGLDCTPEQARRAWEAHHTSSSGNFATNPDLGKDTIEWMTNIMAKLLPPPLALLWGVTPTDLPTN